MTKEDMMKAIKWAVWAACNIGYDQFAELLKQMLGVGHITSFYLEDQWGMMRKDPASWLVNLDDNALAVFCQYALDKYQKKSA